MKTKFNTKTFHSAVRFHSQTQGNSKNSHDKSHYQLELLDTSELRISVRYTCTQSDWKRKIFYERFQNCRRCPTTIETELKNPITRAKIRETRNHRLTIEVS